MKSHIINAEHLYLMPENPITLCNTNIAYGNILSRTSIVYDINLMMCQDCLNAYLLTIPAGLKYDSYREYYYLSNPYFRINF